MTLFRLFLSAPDLLVPDSSSYLEFSPDRTVGYPLILAAVAHFDPDFRSLPYLQMGCLILSAALLVEACNRVRPAPVIWAVVGTAVLANPFVWRYAMSIMSESLYISFSMLFLSCYLMALSSRPKGLGWLALASAFLGITVLQRPVGYALLIAALLGTYFWKSRFSYAAIAAAGPALACILVACASNWIHRGVFATQIFGGGLLASHVALLMPEQLPGPNEQLTARIAADLRPIASGLPHDLSGVRDYYWMTYLSLNSVLHKEILPLLTAAVATSSKTSTDALSIADMRRINTLAWNISIDTIVHEPIAYMKLVAVQFLALWTIPTMSTTEEAAHLRGLLCNPTFGNYFCRAASTDSALTVRVFLPRPVNFAKDIFLLSLMAMSFALPILALSRRRESTLLCGLALIALCINGQYAMTALVEDGLPRYSLAMWPFLCVMTAGSIILIAQKRQDQVAV
jgi:hypothetical protein